MRNRSIGPLSYAQVYTFPNGILNYISTATCIYLPLCSSNTFLYTIVDQLSNWLSTQKYMIDDISPSQGFISRVEHKTREVAQEFTHCNSTL